MSVTSNFLKKHEELVLALKSAFPNDNVIKANSYLAEAAFPLIGLYLGSPEHSKESRTYAPVRYVYLLCVFDLMEMEEDSDTAFARQQELFDKIENVITTMGYCAITDIEPTINLSSASGFISGWMTSIEINS